MLCIYIFLLLTLSRVGLSSLQEKQTDFGLKVFLQLSQDSMDKNVVFSPYGLASVLSMAQLGAAGNTHKALTAALGFSLRGAIPVFLEAGSLSDETRMVLLNALHFQALWKVPFDPTLTQERIFHCPNGSTIPVHMMRLTSHFNYGEFVTNDGVDYDVIEVPYEGDSLSMLLVSPFEPEVPLSELSAALTSKKIQQWTTELRSVKRRLSMPRFILDSEVNLKQALLNLGLRDMFSLATADFTRITTDERLCVSKVLQRVKIEVNERGTKGAAGTAAVMFSRMAVEEITLDRPFLFFIQHKHTGAILFMGQVNQPQQQ
ncbi:plasminogen activator inhibitor 1 isoform X2 [Echeneis naucrates]|uniref:plasminogen activator inhibitor 1 isoform X2 n=1 Tax=Echeneis naucrates TaxID=173247 RepID=UPI0011144685|nr:plasminogen activator inhibitor 1 isoform X2 [Echeneis naucrates]